MSTPEQITRAWCWSVRKAWSLTQAELAAAIGVTRATVNRWENGQTAIPPKTIAWFQEAARRKGWPPPLEHYLHPPALTEPYGPATEEEAAEMRQMEAIFARLPSYRRAIAKERRGSTTPG